MKILLLLPALVFVVCYLILVRMAYDDKDTEMFSTLCTIGMVILGIASIVGVRTFFNFL